MIHRDDGRPVDGSDDRAVYIISVAAELAGVHPQGSSGRSGPAGTFAATRRPTSSGCAACSG